MENILVTKTKLTPPCNPRNFDEQGCPNRSVTCKVKSSDDYCKKWDKYEEDKAEELRKMAKSEAGELATRAMFYDKKERIRKRRFK